MNKHLLSVSFAIISLILQRVQAQEIGPSKGSLILAGGGLLGDEILQRFVDLAGGKNARIVMIPTAGSADNYNDSWGGLNRFKSYNPSRITLLHTRDRDVANSETFCSPLKDATGVWFSGGRQWRLVDSYLNTLVHEELKQVLERNGVIGGSSAGASIQGSYLVRGDTRTNQILMGDHEVGLGFLKNVGVDQHLLRQNRQFDLIPVIRKHPYLLGIGLDEGTAIVVQKDTFEVIGKSYVAVYEREHIDNPAHPFRLLAPSSKYTMKPQNEPISEILFGSCIKENQPVPILNTILEHRPTPGLFIFLGDNIYADTTDAKVMQEKYDLLKADSGFKKLTNTLPILATWDDHDFGANDAGADYSLREESERLFLNFWKAPADSPRRQRPGIYESHIYGPEGKRLQIIVLDTRYFRDPLKKGEKRVGGPYVPTDDLQTTMLGEAQWEWLREQLLKSAEARIIVSSIQLVADDAGQECWANMPHERDRFFSLLKETEANGAIVISGDRHWSELSVENTMAPYPVFDLTSSSFNQSHARGTPTDNLKRAKPTTYHKENYGRIAIDWDTPSVQLEIIDIEGNVQLEQSIQLENLK
ncbi:alkaline phosphatase D family protein [Verrucomicrobia bacterium]|jgi:alkaline phosphatase D|nr:type 1 glutamine amidotransferase-like domain-containing protein [Verrucomicrobiota bacterium]MDB4798515.1 alkaline phosphatase D family protein [Verrucomicrobiota bacterium]